MPKSTRSRIVLVPGCQVLDARIAPSNVNAILAELKRGFAEINGGKSVEVVHHQPPGHAATAHATHVAHPAAHHPHKAR